MIKLVAATTPVLLAATIAASPAAQGQTPAAANPPKADARQVTVVGCVARNGDVDIDKGTRTLNIAPGALALTSARVLSGSATGGVPGYGRAMNRRAVFVGVSASLAGPGLAWSQGDPIAAAIADRLRPAADREADDRRKPAETLAFAQARPGMKVIHSGRFCASMKISRKNATIAAP